MQVHTYHKSQQIEATLFKLMVIRINRDTQATINVCFLLLNSLYTD